MLYTAVYRQGDVTCTFSTAKHPNGTRHLVCADYIVRHLRSLAEAAKERAIAMAPVDTTKYKSSFEVKGGVGPSSRGGRRAYAQLINNTTHALYIEWGNNYIQPYRVLRRAVGQADFSRDRYTEKGSRNRKAKFHE
jgi:hypothetical protein